MFRRCKDGEIVALFPYEIATTAGHVISYQHTGQHGAADYLCFINDTRPATAAEYTDLLLELEGIGYNLKIVKRRYYKECRKVTHNL